VIHTPDPIREIEIADDWMYFIVASDGVWDAMAGKSVYKILAKEKEDAEFDYGKDADKVEKVRKRMTKSFVQTCVDSEYWTKTASDADNTTAIMCFF
jgi:serine/threonine protein phosphatase PrpC